MPPGAARHPTTVVDISDLTVRRGGRDVIPNLTLAIPAGQVVGLLGPSGCGKSTLIRSIVGTQRTRGGTVTVLGRPAGTRSLRHRIGYVTQAPSVYDDLTIVQNVRYFCRILGSSRGDIPRVVETTGLEPVQDRLVGTLSGGERSRLSLAVALLGRPELLVLDEPTVGVDPLLRRRLWEMFHDLADAGSSLLVSSHVMDEAGRCDRIVLMRDGGVLADDSPGALLTTTGAADVEAAFVALVGASASGRGSSQDASP